MTRIAVLTVARSDFSVLLPVMRRIEAEPGFALEVIVAGMHLSPEFGATASEVRAAGYTAARHVEMLLSSDTAEGAAKSMGLGVLGFAQHFGHQRPDLLLLMGDRFEVFAAAAAALPFGIPVAHLHGGELSEGAIDDAMRHAITKMAHIHLVSAEPYRARVIQLGEQPERVFVTGAPALDNLREITLSDRAALERRFAIDLAEPPLVVTLHPTTLEPAEAERHVEVLLAALADSGKPLLFTAPNADPAGRAIRARIQDFVAGRSRAWFVENLGVAGYYGVLKHAAAMVGNSSSGIIEGASFKLPVVDIGNRQRGRLAGRNVIHAAAEARAIRAALARALKPQFRASLADLANPYGDGRAAEQIVAALRSLAIGPALCLKRFHDLPAAA